MIDQKMALLGTSNLRAYLRKMAVDGYVVQLGVLESSRAGGSSPSWEGSPAPPSLSTSSVRAACASFLAAFFTLILFAVLVYGITPFPQMLLASYLLVEKGLGLSAVLPG